MEHAENKWLIDQDHNDRKDPQEQFQVPPTLLPDVLQRLGLTSEQSTTSISMDEILPKLHHEQWEIRAAAVRTLGKMGAEAPIEQLLPALEDQDETVRAAAIYALGRDRRIPLHRLIAALNDASWHVRETAVFALANQGLHVPKEVIAMALHDSDGSVREVAKLVLQQNLAGDSRPPLYGKLWEQKIMSQNSHENGQVHSEAGSYATLFDYSQPSSRAYAVHEQAQEYAPQAQEYERPFYEERDSIPLHGEKVTSYLRRKSQKRWWVIVPITALVFFLLGVGVNSFWTPSFPPGSRGVSTDFISVGIVKPAQPARYSVAFDPQYTSVASNQIADALHLSTAQITEQLKAGKTMIDIASAQKISPNQLHTIELKALSDLLNTEVKARTIDQDTANNFIWQMQNSAGMADKTTTMLFLNNYPG